MGKKQKWKRKIMSSWQRSEHLRERENKRVIYTFSHFVSLKYYSLDFWNTIVHLACQSASFWFCLVMILLYIVVDFILFRFTGFHCGILNFLSSPLFILVFMFLLFLSSSILSFSCLSFLFFHFVILISSMFLFLFSFLHTLLSMSLIPLSS